MRGHTPTTTYFDKQSLMKGVGFAHTSRIHDKNCGG